MPGTLLLSHLVIPKSHWYNAIRAYLPLFAPHSSQELHLTPRKIQPPGFKYHLNPNISHTHFPSADLFSEFQSHGSNCLLDITWMINWNLKSDMSKTELQRTLPKRPSPPAAAPGSLIGSFILSVAQTKNLGVTLSHSISNP